VIITLCDIWAADGRNQTLILFVEMGVGKESRWGRKEGKSPKNEREAVQGGLGQGGGRGNYLGKPGSYAGLRGETAFLTGGWQ